MNGQSGDHLSDSVPAHGNGLYKPPSCGGNLPARADSDELDKDRADGQVVGRRSDIGAEDEAGLARTEDGAGGGPAEERTCARGRGMRLLKIVPDSDASA